MKKLSWLLGVIFSLCLVSLQAQPAPAYSGQTAVQSQINWQPSYNAAVAASQASSKPILILFTGTNWCPACITLERQVLSKPVFAQAVGEKFVFFKAEIPGSSAEIVQASPHKFLLDRYRIQRFPTILVINPDGRVLFSVNYQAEGPEAYINELNHKLNQFRN